MKIAKKQSKINPSERLMTLSMAPSKRISLAKNRRANDESITKGISLVNVPLPTTIGQVNAVQPTIIKILKRLLPTTLPIAKPALPCIAEVMLTTSSGADVPKATIVRPMTKSDILKRFARAEAPSVKAFAPYKIRTSPPINNKIFIMSRCFFIMTYKFSGFICTFVHVS